MTKLETIALARESLDKERQSGKTIGFVPTMGALHDGHLALVKAAKEKCDITVVSIFVNPSQFNSSEDFDKYPRDEAADLQKLEALGVDYVFSPSESEMYPTQQLTFVEVSGDLTTKMCGMSRPGHFRGVSTVVCKLFNIIQAHEAFFGMKDAQQALVIARMIGDLNIPIKLNLIETVREESGLAMSSRNERLSDSERKDATVMYDSLMLARKRILEDGERHTMTVLGEIYEMLETNKEFQIDYAMIVKLPTLAEMEKIEGRTLIAIAGSFGNVRLIDNITLDVD